MTTPRLAALLSSPMLNPLSHLHAAFHEPSTRAYRVVQGTVWALILTSIVLLAVETLLPDAHPSVRIVRRVDRGVLVVFRRGAAPPCRQLSAAVAGDLSTAAHRAHPHPHFVSDRLSPAPDDARDIIAVLALFPELRGLRALRLLRLLRTTRVFRYRNPFAIVLHALEENGLLFTFAFSVLAVTTLLGGVSMFLVEFRYNPSIQTVFDGIWWALVTITTVGYGDVVPATLLGRIVGGVLMVGGMFTLALFAGIVGSSLVSGMLSIRVEQFRMSDYVNHIVIFGFDESTHILLAR